MDPKGAGSELQESRAAAPLLVHAPTVLALVAAALLAARPTAAAARQPPPPQPITYAHDVAPILDRWCVSCHRGREPHAELRLDSYVGVLRGGETGPVVIPHDPDGSLLVTKIERRHRPAMPPRRKLPAAAVRLIRAWIAAGAPA
jgi:hypothetical protein